MSIDFDVIDSPFDECKLLSGGGGDAPCGNNASSTNFSVKL